MKMQFALCLLGLLLADVSYCDPSQYITEYSVYAGDYRVETTFRVQPDGTKVKVQVLVFNNDTGDLNEVYLQSSDGKLGPNQNGNSLTTDQMNQINRLKQLAGSPKNIGNGNQDQLFPKKEDFGRPESAETNKKITQSVLDINEGIECAYAIDTQLMSQGIADPIRAGSGCYAIAGEHFNHQGLYVFCARKGDDGKVKQTADFILQEKGENFKNRTADGTPLQFYSISSEDEGARAKRNSVSVLDSWSRGVFAQNLIDRMNFWANAISNKEQEKDRSGAQRDSLIFALQQCEKVKSEPLVAKEASLLISHFDKLSGAPSAPKTPSKGAVPALSG